jgi:hypothetical protein
VAASDGYVLKLRGHAAEVLYLSGTGAPPPKDLALGGATYRIG